MNKLLKISAGLALALLLTINVGFAFASSGSQVQDGANVFNSSQRSDLLKFANAMQVPAVVITTASFSGVKSDFISQLNRSLPRNGVLIGASTADGYHYYVVLVGQSSGLSNSDATNAYNAGVQYLRSGLQYAPAAFSSLYSLDQALGSQAADSLGISGAPGSGFTSTGGGT